MIRCVEYGLDCGGSSGRNSVGWWRRLRWIRVGWRDLSEGYAVGRGRLITWTGGRSHRMWSMKRKLWIWEERCLAKDCGVWNTTEYGSGTSKGMSKGLGRMNRNEWIMWMPRVATLSFWSRWEYGKDWSGSRMLLNYTNQSTRQAPDVCNVKTASTARRGTTRQDSNEP